MDNFLFISLLENLKNLNYSWTMDKFSISFLNINTSVHMVQD